MVSGEPTNTPSASPGHPPTGNDLTLNVRGDRECRWSFWRTEMTPRVEGDKTLPGQSLLDPHRRVKVDFGTPIKDPLGRDANLEVERSVLCDRLTLNQRIPRLQDSPYRHWEAMVREYGHVERKTEHMRI